MATKQLIETEWEKKKNQHENHKNQPKSKRELKTAQKGGGSNQ